MSLIETIKSRRTAAETPVVEKLRLGDGPLSGWIVFTLFAGSSADGFYVAVGDWRSEVPPACSAELKPDPKIIQLLQHRSPAAVRPVRRADKESRHHSGAWLRVQREQGDLYRCRSPDNCQLFPTFDPAATDHTLRRSHFLFAAGTRRSTPPASASFETRRSF